MNILVSHEKGRVPVTVLSIVGVIDSSNYEQLDQTANREIENGAQYFMIDLSKVHFMSSAAFRSMTDIFKKLRSLSMDENGQEMHKEINAGKYTSPYLKLYKPSKGVQETLRLTGFDQLLEIHKDMKTAIASF